MCPPNAGAHTRQEHTTGPPFPSRDELQPELDRVPRVVLAHVVDVHCHPTDSDFAMTLEAANDLPIRICAMATRRSDQQLVADLAEACPDKVVPCFGWSFKRLLYVVPPILRP